MSDHDTWNRRPTDAEIEAVRSDRRKDWLRTLAVVQVAAAPVLAGKDRK